jgi:hypothetical protein
MPRSKPSAAVLRDAFDYAWELALKGEQVLSTNVRTAPGEILTAVYVAAEGPYLNSKMLGQSAYDIWLTALQETERLIAAMPHSDAVH